MKIRLHIWRQASRDMSGHMDTYELGGVNPDMSFLEMMDHLNEELTEKGEDPVAFDHDCREGVCGDLLSLNSPLMVGKVEIDQLRDGAPPLLSVEIWVL